MFIGPDMMDVDTDNQEQFNGPKRFLKITHKIK